MSRQDLDTSSYRVSIAKALKQFAGGTARDDTIKSFLEMVHYVVLDISSEAGWDFLEKELKGDPSRVRAFYLATAPEKFGPIAEKLAAHSLATPASRIIVEKPIGKDGASAKSNVWGAVLNFDDEITGGWVSMADARQFFGACCGQTVLRKTGSMEASFGPTRISQPVASSSLPTPQPPPETTAIAPASVSPSVQRA